LRGENARAAQESADFLTDFKNVVRAQEIAWHRESQWLSPAIPAIRILADFGSKRQLGQKKAPAEKPGLRDSS